MANQAVKLRQPVARRWPRIPFEIRLVLWWCVWLLVLLFLFSGTQIALGPIQIRTIALDWLFIGEWWPFISKGVIITFELSIISMLCAVVLALSAALARLSRVASLNSFANLYVSLMRGTPLFLQFVKERAASRGVTVEDQLAVYRSRNLMGVTLIPPEAVADVAVLLASEWFRFTTGDILTVDGGLPEAFPR